jgi:hypothetical protein
MVQYNINYNIHGIFTVDVDKINPADGVEGKKPYYPADFCFPNTTIRQDFDANYYMSKYGDLVRKAGYEANPFDYFMKVGIYLNHSYRPGFDGDFYLDNNLDIAVLTIGRAESLDGAVKYYLSGALHHVMHGRIDVMSCNKEPIQREMENHPPAIKEAMKELYKHSDRTKAYKQENKKTYLQDSFDALTKRVDNLDLKVQKTHANQQEIAQQLTSIINDIKALKENSHVYDQQFGYQLNELLSLVEEHNHLLSHQNNT